MRFVNMHQAKSSLSRLVKAIEQGREREIVIFRNGHPVAKLVPVGTVPAGKRIGIAKGKFEVPDERVLELAGQQLSFEIDRDKARTDVDELVTRHELSPFLLKPE